MKIGLTPFGGVQPISRVFPSTAVVERVGWYLDDVTVDDAPVSQIPLPSAAVFLFGAFGMFGAVRARARRRQG